MTERHHEPAPTFAGLVAVELVVTLAIFVIAIVLVKANAVSLQDLQEYFG